MTGKPEAPLLWVEQRGPFVPEDEPTFRAMPSDAAFAQLKRERLTGRWEWAIDGRWSFAQTREEAEAAANESNASRLAHLKTRTP